MSNLDLAGYHLTYDDEFSSAAAFKATPDGSAGYKTQYDWGGRSLPSNSEAEFYSDPSLGVNPFSVQKGELTITAQAATPGQRSDGMAYTSGMITTEKSFSQHGGYFEMRAQVAGGQGVWPAFWMLPTTGADYPEVDIMEDPNLGPTDQYWLHATAPTAGGGGYVQGGSPLAAAYHDYGVEWNDQTITFYFDGHSIAEYATPAAFASLKMYMIATLAIGGVNSWPGTPGNNSIPAQFKIDYLRAYSNNSSDPAVALQTISSPDGAKTAPVLTEVPLPLVTTGTGPDTLVLHTAEDFFQVDAQFTVSIDGVQRGGVFTTLASEARGQTQDFAFKGSFGTTAHTVDVSFVNDAYGGSAFLDRNLYVNSATIDGQAIPGSTLAETNPGTQGFTFVGLATALTPPTYPTVTLGTGPDTLGVSLTEDAYLGNAQFTLAVDGTQVGGTQTVTALHGGGQPQLFDVLGTFAGPHTLTVTFLNDAYGGSSATDRNLYVDGATIDGKSVTNSALSEMSSGPQTIGFTGPIAASLYPTVTLGTGPDMLAVGISEDAWNGNAQFTLSVDGKQIGGTQTASAPHVSKQSQPFHLLGTFGSGPHMISINFLNDAYGGTAATDRNLYVDTLNYNGAESPTDTAALMSSGTVNLGVPATVAAAPDAITFNLTEDAYEGDAQARISLDGKVLGTPTVTFLNTAGSSEAFTYTGNFGPGPHTATVDFLNDAYGGSPTLDRNLYVNSIDYDGVHHADLSAALYAPGPVDFAIPLIVHS